MDPELLKDQGLNPEHPVKAKLTDYKLILADRATMVPTPDSVVWGMVMSLTNQELSHLYAAPSVRDYLAVDIVCLSEQNEKVAAKTYILPSNHPLRSPKDTSYAKNLRYCAIKIELPDSYLVFLNKTLTKIES